LKLRSYFLVIFLLLIGFIIYLLFYPSSIFINKFIQPFLESQFLVDLPIEASTKYIFNIPTAIWSFCFIFSILLISYDIDWVFYLAISLILIPELMQHSDFGNLPGTFDVNDLLMNVIGIITAVFMTRNYNKGIK